MQAFPSMLIFLHVWNVLVMGRHFLRERYTLYKLSYEGVLITWMTKLVSVVIVFLINLNFHLRICRPTGPQLLEGIGLQIMSVCINAQLS